MEYVFSYLTPDFVRGGIFIILPLKQKEETSMSEEMNNQYSFENP